MAQPKFRPSLLQSTSPNLSQYFRGGFVDAGAAQLNQAIQNNINFVRDAKNKKFEQAQALRDGIVSGHFSDAMAESVGNYIQELSELPLYSKEYAAKLAEANADLGVKVARQDQITKEIDEIVKSNDADPSKKYYDNTALNARMYDQLNGDVELNIQGTGIDTTSEDLQNAYKDFRNNINNIKDGEVRKDFQAALGEIITQIDTTGDIENVNSEFAKFTKNSDGSKFLTGYRYDPATRMYVPSFNKNNLPPKGLVELYRGIDKAAGVLMDDYVNNMHKTTADDPNAPIDPVAREYYERQFVLSQMEKLAPGGQIKQSEEVNFRNRPQDPNTGSAANLQLQMKANAVNDMVSNIDGMRNLDVANLPGGQTSVPFVKVDITGDGNPVQMLDITAFNKADYRLARMTSQNIQTGKIDEDYVRPQKVYLSIDPGDGERTLYFEATNSDGTLEYTVYNDRTANQVVQNMAYNTFRSQGHFDAWSFYNKRAGVQSSDGSVNKQIKLSNATEQSQADAIERQNRAEREAMENGRFDAAELSNSLGTNNKINIEKALQPVNNFFAKTGYEQTGLSDRNGKKLTDRKVKFVKFEQYGTQLKDMINSYGRLSYRIVNDDGTFGPIQTADYNTQDLVGNVSGGQGSFDLTAEK